MPRIRGSHAETLEAPPGTFRADGSWDPAALARTPEYDYVTKLVRMRRSSHMTPGMMAEEIMGGQHPGMFREATLATWLELDRRTQHPYACWPLAMTSTSAEETVKRARITFAEIGDVAEIGERVTSPPLSSPSVVRGAGSGTEDGRPAPD